MMRPRQILPVIVFSQFAGTSLWFAANAVIADLQHSHQFGEQTTAYVTSAVQLGFIAGTLVFAYLSIADRFSPRKVFFLCTLAGAATNLGLLLAAGGMTELMTLRFATGFFLAGIYPVGMKIAAGWYDRGLGRALGYLVGALVLGTAFPQLLRAMGTELPWQHVVIWVSVLSLVGGTLMLLFVPDGPHLRRATAFEPRVFKIIFRSRSFRASAFGYFGHMWELYTLWAFLPLWLSAYAAHHATQVNLPAWTFIVIASGFLGCVIGGLLSACWSSARVAATQLLISGTCCLLSPLFFEANAAVLLGFLLCWGITVAGDSPQFSALNAAHAPPDYVGSALTIANCIGFFITVISIHSVGALMFIIEPQYLFLILLPGPVLGLWSMRRLM
jgi:MFS family permease